MDYQSSVHTSQRRSYSDSGAAAPAGKLLTKDEISDIFNFYANFGRSAVMDTMDSMDSFMFMKFAKECPGLLGGTVDRTEIDLIFTKAKPKFERRLAFEHFLDALSAIAERKYPDYPPAGGLRLLIANHLVPHYDLVLHEMNKTGEDVVPLTGIYKRLYDVRNYTGVYAERFRSGDGRINGESDNRAGKVFNGRTNQGTDETIHDISVLMRPDLKSGTMARSKRRAGSRPRSTGGSPRRAGSAGRRPSSVGSRQQEALLASLQAAQSSGDTTQLYSTIMSLASQLKEAPPAAGAGSEHVARRMEELYDEIAHFTQQLERTSDADTAHDLQLAIRARSAEIASLERRGKGGSSRGRPAPQYPSTTNAEGQLVLTDPGALPKLTQVQIQDIFHFYANFGRSAVMTVQESLDSFMFMKFAKECPGLMDRTVNRTEIDLIFTKAKPRQGRRLTFSHFLDALSAIAERKYSEYAPGDGLRLLIANHLVPHYDLVLHEMNKTGEDVVPLTGIYKRLYDVRNYTGVYAERFRSGDGRINGESDNRAGKVFNGRTNQGTDETIHDISVLMRPNLMSGSMTNTKRSTRGGSPRRARSQGRSASSPRRPASAR